MPSRSSATSRPIAGQMQYLLLTTMNSPRAFLSYSWDDVAHRAWVAGLATDLRRDGIESILDQWHVAPGDLLTAFMEKEIRENDYVVIICTPNYKGKFDQRQGGVGFEGEIISAEVLAQGNHRKFIPVLSRGTWEQSAPSLLRGKSYVDLSTAERYRENYQELASTMLGTRSIAPPLGKRSGLPSEKRAGTSISGQAVSVSPVPSITMADSQTALTDKQQGWNGGLNLLFDEFGSAAWQRGLAQDRAQVAVNMEAQIQCKSAVRTAANKQTMRAIVEPFVACLKGESLPSPPFDAALPEVAERAREDALKIVIDAFGSFHRGTGPQANWTWNEIGDNLEKLVEYEGRNRSPNYRAAMADVVRPFFRVLKDVPSADAAYSM